LIADGASFISEVAQSGFSLDMALDAVGGVGGRNRSRGKHHDESSERPAGSCETGNSFDPNTLVLMADGSRKPIKDVKLGDKVLATDPTTGKSAAREVTDVRSHASQRMLVEVTIGTGSVVATDEHPFWVASGKRWSHAIDLKPGHKLATPDNRDATITATRSWSESRRVYNLTIDTDHTYYVLAGITSLLTHNCGTTPTPHVHRTDNDPLVRTDRRHPDEIFTEGFQPKDPKGNNDLQVHVDQALPGNLVSTSRDLEGVGRYPWKYDIDAPGGIDINATATRYGNVEPNWPENEIAFPGGIAPGNIRGAQQYDTFDEPIGSYVHNPNYRR
jgi:hypothetical protein